MSRWLKTWMATPARTRSATMSACRSEKASTRSGSQREDLRNVRRDEGRHPRLLAPDPRRPHRIAGDADDAVLLAEQIQRLDGLFGETDDPAGRELAHGRRYAELPAHCHGCHYLRGHCLNYLAHPFCSGIARRKDGSTHDAAGKTQFDEDAVCRIEGRDNSSKPDMDRVVARMLVRPDLCTLRHTIHGGAVMAFADSVGAAATVINLPADAKGTTTIESKTNFIGGAKEGTHGDRDRDAGASGPPHPGLADPAGNRGRQAGRRGDADPAGSMIPVYRPILNGQFRSVNQLIATFCRYFRRIAALNLMVRCTISEV